MEELLELPEETDRITLCVTMEDSQNITEAQFYIIAEMSPMRL